jgi:copper homeostasis protein
MVLLEIVAYSLASAKAAVRGGADRIELCENAAEGGVTPSLGTLEATKALGLPVHAMIRPRGGDFLYEPDEVAVMERDIDLALAAGVDGLVLGVLRPDATIDTDLCRRLVGRAAGRPVTFHRAFDWAADPFQALDDIMACGCRRVLTSGQAPNALSGAGRIAELVHRAGDDLIIMAGGGIVESHLAELVRVSGVREVHGSFRRIQHSLMNVRPKGVSLGTPPDWDADAIPVADPTRMRAAKEALGRR